MTDLRPGGTLHKPLDVLGRIRYEMLVLAAAGLAVLQIGYETYRGGAFATRTSGLALLLGVALIAGTAVITAAIRLRSSAPARSNQAAWIRALSVRVRYALWVALAVLYVVLIFGPLSDLLELLSVRMVAFILVVLLGGLLIQPDQADGYSTGIAVSALVLGTLHTVLTYLPLISTYPLALGWSETSRFYYASLFLDQQIYGQDLAPSVLHPTRYLLQAIPFLVARRAIWIHRLWQVMLWLGLTAGAVVVLTKRASKHLSSPRAVWFSVWGVLFLFQGPVLYHLLVPVLLVLGLADSRKPWRTSAVVLAASLWAGVSRLNWIPVPAMLAITVFMVERPIHSEGWARYLKWPMAWGIVGLLAGFGSQAAYMRWSGNAAYTFGSSLTSNLLWYRMLPNWTFPPGILLATLLASLPVGLVLWSTRREWQQIHWLRWTAIGGMLLLLLAGGLLVSMKIGGGSNLHNLDAYLVMLLLVGAYAFSGSIARTPADVGSPAQISWGIGATALAIPIAFALSGGGPLRWPDPQQGQRVVEQIRERIRGLGNQDPQVLFIGERHLLTFGRIRGAKLVPDHERVFLMEMAMSQNEEYLSRFHASLRDRQYDLIVSDPLRVQFQGRGRAFGEENDAWVKEVSIPILCDYDVVFEATQAGVELLAPKQGERSCPDG